MSMNKSRLRLGQRAKCSITQKSNLSGEYTIISITRKHIGLQRCIGGSELMLSNAELAGCEFLPSEEDKAIDALIVQAKISMMGEYGSVEDVKLRIAIDKVEKVRNGS